jgi:hypothetical protein
VTNRSQKVAIGICGAEDSMNSDIVAMLEHIAIIDECDTLGQKLETRKTVHKVCAYACFTHLLAVLELTIVFRRWFQCTRTWSSFTSQHLIS